MTTIKDIYAGAQRLINQIIRREASLQGHFLTGALEESLNAEVGKTGKTDIMSGTAAYYARFVNHGFPADKASFKQFPFLVRYFQLRGLNEKEAKGAAAATIHKWMKEGGMPTQASKRFSKTGSRVQMIQNAFVGNSSRIDGYMSDAFDFGLSEKFKQTKNETL